MGVPRQRLLQIASNELIAAQDQMVLLGRKLAVEKVATFLINLSKHAERRGESGTKLYLPAA
jgi:CRP/FNR family transcriptional regulator